MPDYGYGGQNLNRFFSGMVGTVADGVLQKQRQDQEQGLRMAELELRQLQALLNDPRTNPDDYDLIAQKIDSTVGQMAGGSEGRSARGKAKKEREGGGIFTRLMSEARGRAAEARAAQPAAPAAVAAPAPTPVVPIPEGPAPNPEFPPVPRVAAVPTAAPTSLPGVLPDVPTTPRFGAAEARRKEGLMLSPEYMRAQETSDAITKAQIRYQHEVGPGIRERAAESERARTERATERTADREDRQQWSNEQRTLREEDRKLREADQRKYEAETGILRKKVYGVSLAGSMQAYIDQGDDEDTARRKALADNKQERQLRIASMGALLTGRNLTNQTRQYLMDLTPQGMTAGEKRLLDATTFRERQTVYALEGKLRGGITLIPEEQDLLNRSLGVIEAATKRVIAGRGAGAGGGSIRLKSWDDPAAKRIPVGAPFIGPDGKTYTKGAQ